MIFRDSRNGDTLPTGRPDLADDDFHARQEDRASRPDVQGPPLVTQLLTIIRRRRWVLLGAIGAALVVGLIATLLMTRQYTATAIIEIQRETSSFTDVQGSEPRAGFPDQEFYETQYGLLKSRSLAERVASDLRLDSNANFFATFKRKDATAWFADGRLIAAAPKRDVRISAAADILLAHASISPERLSRLVEVSFTSPDPALSEQVANTWGHSFVQVTLERRYEATSYARKFLERQLGTLRDRINQSQRQLVDYAGHQGIVNLPGQSTVEGGSTGQRSLDEDALASLNQQLLAATADRVQAESRLSGSPGAVVEALSNTAITTLRQNRAQLAGDYARMMVQFAPDYPPAKALQQQIGQLDAAISREETRVQATLRGSYQSSLQREQALRAQLGVLKSGVLDLRRRSIQYDIYQRDVDTNRQLYEGLLQRYKAIGVAGGVGVNNISIVDAAELPGAPSSPNTLLNMAIALLAGIVIGVALALALEQIDHGITDPEEVERTMGVPLLGTVPQLADGDPIDALKDPKSSLTEAYTSLRTRLSFSTSQGVPRILAITSTRPAEGKTTTSLALAQALARLDRRVILIDADMRAPSMHHVLGMANDAGLSNYLSGESVLADLIRETGYPDLWTMTSGPQPPSAAELLSGDRFASLLDELARSFDHVVFDAPPVMGLADAPLIAHAASGVVFVVEFNGTQKNMARVALDRLMSADATLLGIVLTKFDARKTHVGYGYGYGYGGYGYGNGERSAK